MSGCFSKNTLEDLFQAILVFTELLTKKNWKDSFKKLLISLRIPERILLEVSESCSRKLQIASSEYP